MTPLRPLLLLVSLHTFSACNAPPPRNWLRYQLDGVTEWLELSPTRYGGEVLGADVSIDLGSKDTRILVTVANRGNHGLTVRLGPDAGGSAGPIGEVLLRPLDGGGDGEKEAGLPGMLAYQPHGAVAVATGWRASFYLDRPLGRDPKLGQYFVLSGRFESEVEGAVTTRLPLTAQLTN